MIDSGREAGSTSRCWNSATRRATGYCGKLFALGAEVVRVDGIDSAETPMIRALDAYLHRGKQRVGLDRESEPDR